MQSDESFSNARLPQYFVNMVAAHHSLDKQTRHTSMDIPGYSRRDFDSQPAVLRYPRTGSNTSNFSAPLYFGGKFAISSLFVSTRRGNNYFNPAEFLEDTVDREIFVVTIFS